jgi:uracil phosphoribosyltransferase
MIKVVRHVLVQEKLGVIRNKSINSIQFREGMIEIGRMISYKFANTLKTEPSRVETPLGISDGIKITDRKDIVVVNVLRAAIPLVEGIMSVFSEAQCGVVGAWRSDTPPFNVNVGYARISDVQDKIVVVADPMLATGNTMNAILTRIKESGTPRRLVVFNVIASEEGLKKVLEKHPEVEIYTCSVEKKLNKEGYIVPGLGDAGDIAFGKPCN